ncbi:hypothetical protein [Methanosarcina barkeri]|uniref:hypothetical protein n=1 Tax=Methanosarcina barkeri TaxID=2208 RepID=UPI000AB00FD2|nr:hypothetical protein [Methanosarcina barkeri]
MIEKRQSGKKCISRTQLSKEQKFKNKNSRTKIQEQKLKNKNSRIKEVGIKIGGGAE